MSGSAWWVWWAGCVPISPPQPLFSSLPRTLLLPPLYPSQQSCSHSWAYSGTWCWAGFFKPRNTRTVKEWLQGCSALASLNLSVFLIPIIIWANGITWKIWQVGGRGWRAEDSEFFRHKNNSRGVSKTAPSSATLACAVEVPGGSTMLGHLRQVSCEACLCPARRLGDSCNLGACCTLYPTPRVSQLHQGSRTLYVALPLILERVGLLWGPLGAGAPWTPPFLSEDQTHDTPCGPEMDSSYRPQAKRAQQTRGGLPPTPSKVRSLRHWAPKTVKGAFCFLLQICSMLFSEWCRGTSVLEIWPVLKARIWGDHDKNRKADQHGQGTPLRSPSLHLWAHSTFLFK